MPNNTARTLIIAEAGVNHNGSLELAKQLVDAAALAGADIVKFQTFRAGAIASASAPKAAYQSRTSPTAESQLDMLRKLELSPKMHETLMAHCADRGIRFLSTPFDTESTDLLVSLGIDLFKIPSGEITNLPYLRHIGGLGCDCILSTGMSTLDEIRAALDVLHKAGTPPARVTLLHCTTEYPAPYDEINLRAMAGMRAAFPDVAGVGYSDHSLGIAVPIAAVALGACVIEKHFTLDKSMEGPDHRASLEPDELTGMCRAIRAVEESLGDGVKAPSPSEIPNLAIARKSLVASRAIVKGELFTEENLTTKRPGTGLSPMLWDTVIGTPASRNYAKDELL